MGFSWDTVVCSMTWLLNGSEAGCGLVLIKTSLFLLCKSSCSYADYQSKVGVAKMWVKVDGRG